MLLIFELHLLHSFYWHIEIIIKWSFPLTLLSMKIFTLASLFNTSAIVILLFSSSCVTISGSSLERLASSAAASLVYITSAILLLQVSCLQSIIRGSITSKDVTTSMSKSMYLSMSVSEESWSNTLNTLPGCL